MSESVKTCSCGHTEQEDGHTHGESCPSSHGHSHKDTHAHNGQSAACACGHEHGHEEIHTHHHKEHSGEACACEHNHEETHTHGHHDEGCECCHDHGHGDGCACGHEHTHEEGDSPLPLILSGVLFVAGMLMSHVFHVPDLYAAIVYGLATVISGYKVFWSGVKNLVKLNFNENVLMAIAIITAFCLGEFSEAALVAILFCIGEIAEGIAERNSRKSIQALTDIRPDSARVLQNGTETTVPAEQVKIGDRIAVNPFERIPVDGKILEGNSYIDNAALTGESVPVPVGTGDSLLSGGINGSSRIIMEATTSFADSTSSRILKMIEESSAKKGSAEKLITRFAKVYTPIVIMLAVLVAIVPPLLGMGAFTVWLYRALVMLVASCPCALIISVPLGFFAGIGAQSKIGMLIKGGKYLEALAKADAVIMDKTGTITTSSLRIAAVEPAGGLTEEQVLTMAAAAEALSAHPVGRAICARVPGTAPAADISEIPGKGITASWEGKRLCIGRKDFLAAEGINITLSPSHTVYLAVDSVLVGGITLADTVKEDSPAAIQGLKALGIDKLVMLTGDNERSAKEVAAACGIQEFHAALLPADKADYTQKLTRRSKLFVGDGVNDAPVLAAADCGIAMGLGSQAAIETADAVLSSGKLSVLPQSITLARKAMGVIRFNIIFSIALKAVILVLAGLGYAPMWLGIVADVGVMLITVLNSMRLIRSASKTA